MPRCCSCSCRPMLERRSRGSHAWAARLHVSTSSVLYSCIERCRAIPRSCSALSVISLRRMLSSGSRGLRAQSTVASTPDKSVTVSVTPPEEPPPNPAEEEAAAGGGGGGGGGAEEPALDGVAAAVRPVTTSESTRSCSTEIANEIGSSTVADSFRSLGAAAASPLPVARVEVEAAAEVAPKKFIEVGASSCSFSASSRRPRPSSEVVPAAASASSRSARRGATVTGARCDASVAMRQSTRATSSASCVCRSAFSTLAFTLSRRQIPSCGASAGVPSERGAASAFSASAPSLSLCGGSSNHASHAHGSSRASSASPAASAAATSADGSRTGAPVADRASTGGAEGGVGARMASGGAADGSGCGMAATTRIAARNDDGASATRTGWKPTVSCSGAIVPSPCSMRQRSAGWDGGWYGGSLGSGTPCTESVASRIATRNSLGVSIPSASASASCHTCASIGDGRPARPKSGAACVGVSLPARCASSCAK